MSRFNENFHCWLSSFPCKAERSSVELRGCLQAVEMLAMGRQPPINILNKMLYENRRVKIKSVGYGEMNQEIRFLRQQIVTLMGFMASLKSIFDTLDTACIEQNC